VDTRLPFSSRCRETSYLGYCTNTMSQLQNIRLSVAFCQSLSLKPGDSAGVLTLACSLTLSNLGNSSPRHMSVNDNLHTNRDAQQSPNTLCLIVVLVGLRERSSLLFGCSSASFTPQFEYCVAILGLVANQNGVETRLIPVSSASNSCDLAGGTLVNDHLCLRSRTSGNNADVSLR
jgi:hypothetical protein